MALTAKNSDDPSHFSLSSAILAQLTSLVQAQVHSSRAFLNYLLQLGYRHSSLNENGEITTSDDQLTPYTLPFVNKVQIDGKEVLQRIEIPALALVPSIPLGIESAEFEYQFNVDQYTHHNQLQSKRTEQESKENQGRVVPDALQIAADAPAKNTNRPWYLVEDPVSFQGSIGSKDAAPSESGSCQQSSIHIKIKVGQMAVPSRLDKLLTALTQSASVHIVPSPPAAPVSPAVPPATQE